MAEAIRSGLEAVSKGQIESALSIGLTPFQAFRYVIFPQAFAIATQKKSSGLITKLMKPYFY